MTIQTPLHAEHQLDQLAGQFAHWRQTRPHPHSPIPSELWAQAVALTTVVSPSLTTSCQATPGLVKLLPVTRSTSRVPCESVIRMRPPLVLSPAEARLLTALLAKVRTASGD